MPTLGSVTNKLLGTVGLQLTRAPKKEAIPDRKQPDVLGKTKHLEALSKAPTDAEAHLRYAEFCLNEGLLDIAHSELRTANYLGVTGNAYTDLDERIQKVLPPLEEIAHNRYYRLHSLAKAILEQGNGLSVLDVGGGAGDLSRFIPNNPYCLAEPIVNGISGQHLPFDDRSFDLVVSCHVLEHIPKEGRDEFLDNLLSKAKRAVILINPYHLEGTEERLQFVVDEWNAEWAKEHIDCEMPRTDDVLDYAKRRGLSCTMTPNANMATTYSLIWVDNMMNRKGMRDKWSNFNRFVNTKMLHMMDSASHPTAYLAVLERK